MFYVLDGDIRRLCRVNNRGGLVNVRSQARTELLSNLVFNTIEWEEFLRNHLEGLSSKIFHAKVFLLE